jgi:hypothetical protein
LGIEAALRAIEAQEGAGGDVHRHVRIPADGDRSFQRDVNMDSGGA